MRFVAVLAFVSPLLAAACQQPSATPTPAAPPAAAPASPVASPSRAASPSPRPAVSPSPSPIALPPEIVVTANHDDRSLSVVDPIAARVLSTIGVDRPVHSVAISPDQRTAYATDPSENSKSVIVADLGQGRSVGDVNVGARPDSIAVAASTGEVAVTNSGDGTISTFDAASRRPGNPIQVGNTPRGVTLGAVGGGPMAYVANEGDASVSVVDLQQRRMVATVQVEGRPSAVAASVDAARVFALDTQGGNVAVIDARSIQAVGMVHVGDKLTGLDTTADGRFLLVTADDPSNNLYKVDLSNDQVVGTLNVGAGALAIATSPRMARAYVTTTDNRLVIWDTSADRAAGTVPVGRRPEGVAVRVQPSAAPAASPSPSPAVSPAPARVGTPGATPGGTAAATPATPGPGGAATPGATQTAVATPTPAP